MRRAPTNANLVAIALGDAAGVGVEVTLKALAVELDADATRYLLIGDRELVHAVNQQLGLRLELGRTPAFAGDDRICVANPISTAVATAKLCSPHSPETARAALSWLKHGAELCLRGEADALVTAPVNKESIIRAGEKDFIGQTELLSSLANAKRTAMMLLGHDDRGRWLRVALATTHLPIAKVASALTRPKVETAIQLAAAACRQLGRPRARVAVCGLNPHAGEGGKIGNEEITTIRPAVESTLAQGFDVLGPLPADTLFHHALRGDYDAVVAMYHDQGLAPLKMIAFDTGVNWTLGLPFIRTSPDHGTAYDIAGKGIANPSSMIAAIRLAKQLARPR